MTSPVHAVVFTYPLQGHIIPAFNLAKKLASKGLVVTLVCTEGCYARITKANNGRDPFTDNATKLGLDIRTALVSDGLPVDFDRSLNLHEFFTSLVYNMESHVEEFVRDLQAKGPPISCIIADTFFTWASRITKKFRNPYVSFWTEAVLVFAIYYNRHLFVKNGHLPFTGNGNEGEEINYIPGAAALKLTDLPSYLQESDVSTIEHTSLYQSFQAARAADWIVSNTVHELESRTIEELQVQSGIPFLSVGPLLPPSLLEDNAIGKDEMRCSMWAESDCSAWLDGKPKHSVIYVSFGSFAYVSKAQIHEMAMGLLRSERPFIWVLRPDIVASNVQDILPEGFLEESKDKGIVVHWLSQLDVLSHSSVGGFLTHCGWNSIMESLMLGVPMLAFPLVADQYTNCRLIVEEWGVGMRLGECSRSKNNMRSTLVRSEEIALSIEEFMNINGGEGKKIRGKIESVRQIMKKTVMNGGSSQKNLDLFVRELNARAPLS